MKQLLHTHVTGHVLIKDTTGGVVQSIVLDKDNAIHTRNMAIAIARGLANSNNHQIFKVVLGNGGTTVDTNDDVFYQQPNVTGAQADLYNVTYEEVIDEQNGAPAGNSVEDFPPPTPSDTTTTVKCTIVLTANEPVGQNPDDGGPTDVESGTYVFDELGLKTNDPAGPDTSPTGGLLLSHIIFSPIEKTANRELTIEYTLTISVS